jgi:hypothetical protein
MKSQPARRGTGRVCGAFPSQKEKGWSVPMDRVPIILYVAVFAVIGVLAVSSVYVTEKDDATMKAVGLQPAPASIDSAAGREAS